MAKHKYIETPEKMWELFSRYVEKTKSKPFLVKDWVGKDGDEIYREKEKPLTMEGFRAYGFENEVTIKHYFDNPDNAYDDYRTICSRISTCIKQDQIEGGMAGMYNPSITQRLNGLVEKVQSDTNLEVKGLPIQINTNSPPLANDEK